MVHVVATLLSRTRSPLSGAYPGGTPCATGPVPTLPPGLSDWLPSGFFTALLGLIWYEVKASEARTNKRIDELRSDLKDGLARLDARQREDVKELREKMDALPLKIMEMLRTAPR